MGTEEGILESNVTMETKTREMAAMNSAKRKMDGTVLEELQFKKVSVNKEQRKQ